MYFMALGRAGLRVWDILGNTQVSLVIALAAGAISWVFAEFISPPRLLAVGASVVVGVSRHNGQLVLAPRGHQIPSPSARGAGATMKILVYPHDLRIGGSQINAIDLGAAVRDLGHDVAVFGQPGPLVESVRRANLEFIPAPPPQETSVSCRRPGPVGPRAQEGGLDILHGYEWPPALECLLASRLAPGSLSVATVMSMSVAPFIPKTMPLVVGTAQILEAEAHYGRQRLQLLEPPRSTSRSTASRQCRMVAVSGANSDLKTM